MGDVSLRCYGVLGGISPGYPPVTARLHTCYSPVRRSPAGKGKPLPPLPLDLHVLSLSLAFILSQDQTLRCCYLVFFISKVGRKCRRLTAGLTRLPHRQPHHEAVVPSGPSLEAVPAGAVRNAACCLDVIFGRIDIGFSSLPARPSGPRLGQKLLYYSCLL